MPVPRSNREAVMSLKTLVGRRFLVFWSVVGFVGCWLLISELGCGMQQLHDYYLKPTAFMSPADLGAVVWAEPALVALVLVAALAVVVSAGASAVGSRA